MTEPTPNHPRKITLEELLRLKRHERPGAEFWSRFDRELNEKVWRTLVQPPVPAPRRLSNWLLRGMGWMAAGAVSVFAVALAWPGRQTAPALSAPSTVAAVSPANLAAAVPVISTADDSTHFASAIVTTPVDVSTPAHPTYAVADLTTSTSPAGQNKIPATLSFTERNDGERFAADSINSALLSTRWRGSAY